MQDAGARSFGEAAETGAARRNMTSHDTSGHSPRRNRQALAVEDLSDAEVEAIGQAEPPSEAALYDREVAGPDLSPGQAW